MCKTYGITTLGNEFGWNRITKDILFNSEIPSFTIEKEIQSCYEEPFLSIQEGDLQGAQILLVSCPGAVGKTAFSSYLSQKYGMPILDLAKHPAVGAGTVTSIFADTSLDLNTTKEYLHDGRSTIIVDALDEGLLKVSTDGFEAFMDDIVKLSRPCGDDVMPFIMTGRYGAIFEAAKHLEKNQIKYCWMQIEPFTIAQAKSFIDKRLGKQMVYAAKYKEARDLVINSIECFFKKQSDSENKNYKNFIGYAPVLIAIARIFDSQKNYQEIINDINKPGSKKNVDLLLSLISEILDRERNAKVIPELVEGLIKARDDQFRQDVLAKVYSPVEQCARILSIVMGKGCDSITEVNDEAFNKDYLNRVRDFTIEHPFLDGQKFQNVVFESYVIAVLVRVEKYQSLVTDYIQSNRFKNSFALYPICSGYFKNNDSQFSNPSVDILFELADSFTSLSSSSISCEVIIETYEEVDDENYISEIEATFLCTNRDDDKTDEESLIFKLSEFGELTIRGELYNTTISGEIDVKVVGEKFSVNENVHIDCRTFTLASGEFVVNGNCTIVADKVTIEPLLSSYPKVTTYGNMYLSTLGEVKYPLSEYISDKTSHNASEYDRSVFNKFRRLLLKFKCDSKGQGNWAKHKGHIDSRFSKGLGNRILQYLINEGIIFEQGVLYHINVPKMEKKLAVKYDNLRNCEPSETMIDFMNKMP